MLITFVSLPPVSYKYAYLESRGNRMPRLLDLVVELDGGVLQIDGPRRRHRQGFRSRHIVANIQQ